ncbi:CPBP family intramembrane glutamic endopeptidase [Winogradskyella aquimaris]|uniref:CPBP family intramembrane glutamic endopeptidase n=1 Tax=Winogradskyella aquimaris TaxID=864074 RepID=A0ABU5ENJ9_9FLAO|nr:CPBP family intramembrane glutamic endopeptidase [Winogradskyella aquimaris]MDY2587813.1 CPBP family intramembrane glutamic endopeptidase [Winogradskyella aquimaris]
MLNKLYRFLSKPYMVIIVMIIAPILSIADRNYGYFFGLFIALFLLWKSGWEWAKFGFGQKISLNTVFMGLLLAVFIFIVVDICIQPFIEIYFGQVDLSSLEDIRGDFASLLPMLFIVWTFVAFGEEFLFSGYYMKHLAEFMGDTNKTWFASAIILSVYFGISHNYQGTSGMIAVGLASTLFFFTFYKYRTNLALLVFAHGFYDTIGLTLIYLNQDRIFYNWALNMISN